MYKFTQENITTTKVLREMLAFPTDIAWVLYLNIQNVCERDIDEKQMEFKVNDDIYKSWKTYQGMWGILRWELLPKLWSDVRSFASSPSLFVFTWKTFVYNQIHGLQNKKTSFKKPFLQMGENSCKSGL